MTMRLKGVQCPTCEYQYDAVTGIEPGSSPEDGDISVCVRCGEVAVFVVAGDSLSLREVDIDELKAVYAEHPELLVIKRDRRAALRGALNAERNMR